MHTVPRFNPLDSRLKLERVSVCVCVCFCTLAACLCVRQEGLNGEGGWVLNSCVPATAVDRRLSLARNSVCDGTRCGTVHQGTRASPPNQRDSRVRAEVPRVLCV